MSGTPWTEIETLLERKLDAWEAFIAATRRLQEAVESDDDAAAGRLIARRDDLIETLDALDGRLGACLPPPGRLPSGLAALEALRRRVALAVHTAAEANRHCEAAAKRRRDALGEALRSLQRTKTGLQGYGDASRPQARFLAVQT